MLQTKACALLSRRCCAAIAAARNGASTVLIERNGMFGGITTKTYMNSMTNILFTRDDRQVIRGIAEEILSELERREAITPYWRTNVQRQTIYGT